MSKFNTSFIIFLASTSLIGLLIIQMIWLQKGIRLQEERFNHQMCLLLQDAQNSLSTQSALNDKIIKLLQKPESKNSKTVAIQKSGSIDRSLRHLLDSLLQIRKISLDYTYQIFGKPADCTEANQLAQQEEDMSFYSFSLGKRINECVNLSCQSATTYHLGLIFPNKYYYLLKQVSSQLLISCLLIALLLFCFAYTIFTIFEQKKLSDIKNDFINNLTHELKTPIFSISLISKVFKKSLGEKSFENADNYLSLIEKENEQLKSQVEKVLQIALMENKGFQLDLKKIDLHQTIRKAITMFEFIAQQKQGHIKLSLNAQNPNIRADETQMAHLLYNLLDNALKYSAEKPEIEIITQNKEEGIVLIVKDKGIGIRTKDKKHIFVKFYRVNTGNLHTTKGFGLGLSYVKMIVEAHKGLITLHSRLNHGSEFQVYLPVKV